MPNICSFEMKIRGQKKNVELFYDWLRADYNYDDNGNAIVTVSDDNGTEKSIDHHIGYRVFEVWTEDVDKNKKKLPEDEVTYYIEGSCAWSVMSCTIEGYPQDYESPKSKCLTLPKACLKAGVECEVFSTETGMCFAEHYLIDKSGEFKISEETEYLEEWISDYETYEDFIEDNPDSSISKKDYETTLESGAGTYTTCKWNNNGKDNWPWTL